MHPITRATRHPLLVLLTLALAACAGRAPADVRQSAPPADAADTAGASRQRAVALLERSLRALGGRARVLAARGAEVDLEQRAATGGPNQAYRWTDSTPNPIPNVQHLLLDLAGQRAIFEFHSVSPGDIHFNYRTRYDTAGVWQIDLLRWRLGTDVLRAPAQAGRANLAVYGRFLPHLAVRQALLARPSLRSEGARVRDGRSLDVVTFTDPAGQLIALELDAASALPAFVVGRANNSSVEFTDYRTVDGVRVAFGRAARAGTQLLSEQRMLRVSLRPSLADSSFQLPPGYADPPAPGAPRATRIAEGVYRLDDMPGGYHAAFVVRPEGVAVLEAPTDAAYTDVALRLIAETAPGKPVTHVFVTHHHNDHVGGLGPYVARGAVLVVGAGLEEAVRRQLLPDSLRARARFEPVSSTRTFFSGADRIEAHPVANTHAEGNTAYYLPAPRVLFQGDLFYIPERGDVPPAFPVTDALARMVRADGLAVDQVVGVHGRSGRWADVETSLRLPRR